MSTKSEIVQKVLDRFDRNGDDVITFKEFKEALIEEGVDEATADVLRKQAFRNWDGNDDAKLVKSEIEKLAKKWASFA